MNKDQENHFRMFLNTQGFLDNHTPTRITVPRVASYKNDFDELISRITALSEEAAQTVGVTRRKEIL